MGAAGKRREEELLAQIAALEATVREKENRIAEQEAQQIALREQVRMKEADIAELEQKIIVLEAKIADLEKQLQLSMQSGDEATQALRRQLQEVTEEFSQFKITSKQEFDAMQDNLNEKHARAIQELKDKYERMLQEMKNNASSDKEFLQMELQKRIQELE